MLPQSWPVSRMVLCGRVARSSSRIACCRAAQLAGSPGKTGSFRISGTVRSGSQRRKAGPMARQKASNRFRSAALVSRCQAVGCASTTTARPRLCKRQMAVTATSRMPGAATTSGSTARRTKSNPARRRSAIAASVIQRDSTAGSRLPGNRNQPVMATPCRRCASTEAGGCAEATDVSRTQQKIKPRTACVINKILTFAA